ncbi:MAG: efflux transporter outer membrane subunit [Magnetococcales bacterium]|nr:efflux transporter outer membrane subunit [Magnetococcales bacterium]
MLRFRLLMMLVPVLTGLSGCMTLGSDYERPGEVIPTGSWQAALPHGGSQDNLIDWWGQLQDDTLKTLLSHTLKQHPGLEGALAAIEVARSNLVIQKAAGQVRAEVDVTAMRSGDKRNPKVVPMTARTVVADAVWEIDLFGRVKRATEGAEAKVAAREADWQGMRVALAAEVATLYFEWRGCERLRASLSRDVASRESSMTITEKAIRAGLSAPNDGDLAAASLADARSALTQQQASCDVAVKGLVALTGMDEASLRQLLQKSSGPWPRITPFTLITVPAQLLSQRPDLAGAEQELVAANAEVGVAEATRYPRLSLLGSVGVGVGFMGSPTQDTQPWSFGPALTLTGLDGGALEANVQAAKGRWKGALASYRKAVQAAVREVESTLVNLGGIQNRVLDGRKAYERYAAYLVSSETNWKKGGISLLTLEEARRRAMAAERGVIQLETQEVQQWITLYKVLGGGWQQTVTNQKK